MLNRIAIINDIVKKVGRKNASELLHIFESNEPYTVEVKIHCKELKEKKERIQLSDNQEVVLEYVKD